MDGEGNFDWKRILQTNSKKYHQFRASTTSNNEIIIAGTSYQILAGGYKEDAFMTKLDNLGNILWSHAYGTADEDDWGWKVFETPAKNLVLIGSTKSYGSSLYDIYLMGANPNGISE